MVVYRPKTSRQLFFFVCLQKGAIMEKELKQQETAYTEKDETTKTPEKKQEVKPDEREFWLSVKYSDDHRESDR
jgi:hypothetical protein